MEDGGAGLLAAMLAGVLGLGLLVYGRKQRRVPHLVAGFALCAYPYFIDNALIIGGIGVAVIGLLVLATRMGA